MTTYSPLDCAIETYHPTGYGPYDEFDLPDPFGESDAQGQNEQAYDRQPTHSQRRMAVQWGQGSLWRGRARRSAWLDDFDSDDRVYPADSTRSSYARTKPSTSTHEPKTRPQKKAKAAA
jgi:hypothetical protein